MDAYIAISTFNKMIDFGIIKINPPDGIFIKNPICDTNNI